VPTAVGAHSRLAYSEVLNAKTAEAAAAFWLRAAPSSLATASPSNESSRHHTVLRGAPIGRVGNATGHDI
jgi:hypothetical protein